MNEKEEKLEYMYEDEQQKEQKYFELKQEKIDNTKKKLQNLLEKLQEQPPKETITKKLLRLRVNRLRTQLNRSIEKFNIEYEADLLENENYDKFVSECGEIRIRLERLQELEDDLEFQLESHARKEKNKVQRKEDLDYQIQQMAPKGKSDNITKKVEQEVKSQDVENLEKRLKMVKNAVAEVQEELEGKIAGYREYKVNLEQDTQEKVQVAMEKLKEEEKQRKAQQKEQLALTAPSMWQKIVQKVKTKVKEVTERISNWNTNRKAENIKRSQLKNELILQDMEQIMDKKTARQEFLENITANTIEDENIQNNIAESVKKVLDEKVNNKDEEVSK